MIMGDGGFWHNGLITGVASNYQQRRRRSDCDAERLRVGNRPAIHPVERGQQGRPGARNGHRADFTCAGRKMAAHGATYSVSTMVKTLKEAMKTATR